MQKAKEDSFQKGWSALFNPAQQPRKMRAGLCPILVGDVDSYSGGAENRGQTWVGDVRDVRVRWRRRRFSSQKGGQGIFGRMISAGVGGPSVRKCVRRTQNEAELTTERRKGAGFGGERRWDPPRRRRRPCDTGRAGGHIWTAVQSSGRGALSPPLIQMLRRFLKVSHSCFLLELISKRTHTFL